MGDEASALTATERLLTEFKDTAKAAKATDGIADEYRKKDKHEKALSLYKVAVDSWPGAGHAIQSQGGIARCYIALGDEEKAAAAVDKLVTGFGGHPELRNVLGDVAEAYEEHERYDGAKAVYSKMAEIAAGGTGIEERLETAKTRIVYHINDGNDTAALTGIVQLIADYNDRPELLGVIFEIAKKYYDIGRVYQRDYFDVEAKEQFEKTAAILEASIAELRKEDIEATVESYHLAAENYRRLRDHVKAAECYQKVVDLDPDFKYAWHAQFMVGYSYDRLWNQRAIEKSEAERRIREAYEKLLREYPGCPASKAARMWLDENRPGEKGGGK
jgi:tetratricopeptide (TPR) repeat protein